MTAREQLADTLYRRTAPALRLRARPAPFRVPGERSADIVSIPGVRATHDTNQRLLKRALDLCVAVSLLAALALPMALIAVLIRLDSEGPALFRQKRLGHGGRPFDILKFRTMRVLENGDTIVQARPDDARVTRLGRILRKSSLDELPQLINVIRGEMSVVGPRPHAVAHDRYFGALIDSYELRQRAKPGITGWAQIHGLRGETPTVDAMRARVQFDIWYAQHLSLWLDLRILLQTPREILRQRNAF